MGFLPGAQGAAHDPVLGVYARAGDRGVHLPVHRCVGHELLDFAHLLAEGREHRGGLLVGCDAHVDIDFGHGAGEGRTLGPSSAYRANPCLGCDLCALLRAGVFGQPLLDGLNHGGGWYDGAAKARSPARHAGISHRAFDGDLEPAQARMLVIHLVPRLEHHAVVRSDAMREQMHDAVRQTGVIALGHDHRHAAAREGDHQIAFERRLGVDQRIHRLDQGCGHALGVGST